MCKALHIVILHIISPTVHFCFLLKINS